MANTTAQKHVLFRFSLYGFLKNQTYYEPFLILAFLEKGLSFFMIGLLVGFRDLCINLFEIPSGAVADLYGRRKAMIISFGSYIVSFAVLALSNTLWHLFAAMFFFSLGEVFRTGTHKAMIFDWLRSQGRENERVRVYGYTRSWSKIGSAVAAGIAAGLVFWRGRYSDVFWLCIIPYVANIVNFLGYPPESEGDATRRQDKQVTLHVWTAMKQAWQNRAQRRLLLESTGFEGTFEVVKDYLQPTLNIAALSLPLMLSFESKQRTAVLVGIVYCILYLFSSVASRQAHRVAKWRGSDDGAALFIWVLALGLYSTLIPGLLFKLSLLAIPAFVLLHLIQNLWRPALVSRLNAASHAESAATTLSIESQVRSLYGMFLAPLLGLAVDHVGLWPVGVVGAIVAGVALIAKPRTTNRAAGDPTI